MDNIIQLRTEAEQLLRRYNEINNISDRLAQYKARTELHLDIVEWGQASSNKGGDQHG